MRRLLAVTTAAVLLLAGCGGGSDSTATTAPGTTEIAPPAMGKGGSPAADPGAGEKQERKQSGSPGTGAGTGAGSRESEEPAGEAPKRPPKYKPDKSLQRFGDSAAGVKKAEAIAAMRAYLQALASRDYKVICGMVRQETREQALAYLEAKHESGGCPAALAPFLEALPASARDALAGEVTGVREKGPDVVIFLTPRGGSASYLTMTREGGKLRVISLTAGTPLNPVS